MPGLTCRNAAMQQFGSNAIDSGRTSAMLCRIRNEAGECHGYEQGNSGSSGRSIDASMGNSIRREKA